MREKPYLTFKVKFITSVAVASAIALSIGSVVALTPLAKEEAQTNFTPNLILAGEDTTQIIAADNSRVIRGLNDNGQLGSGNQTAKYMDWATVENNAEFTELSGKYDHTLGLTKAERVYAWGSNRSGQTAVNSTNSTVNPTQIIVPLPYQKITSGLNHVLALNITNNLVAWGENDLGQLGLGNVKTPVDTPQVVVEDRKFNTILAVDNISYAIDTDNNLWAWGSNDKGQLGLDSKTEIIDTPTQVADVKVKAVASNGVTSLAITTSGDLISWGDNRWGQLGNGVDWRQLQKEENERVAREIARIKQEDADRRAALIQTCEDTREAETQKAIEEFEEAEAERIRNLPTPTPVVTPGATPTPTPVAPTPTPTPTPEPDLPEWDTTCAEDVDKDFTPRDTSGMKPEILSVPDLTPDTTKPVNVAGNQKFTSIAVGSENSYAVAENGKLYGWGSDENGQSSLGLNEKTFTQVPVTTGSGTRYTQVSAGTKVGAALTTGNELQVWGDGEKTGLTLQEKVYITPTSVKTNVKTVNLYNGTGFYTNTDNDVFAWGQLPEGILSTGGVFQMTKVFLPTNLKLNAVTITENSGLGLNQSNHLVVWGKNSNHTFGFGTASDEVAPAKAVSIQKFKDIAAGNQVTGLVDQNGLVWMIGNNHRGQIGLYANKNKTYEPAPVPLPVKIKYIAIGLYSVYAIGEDNSVFTWGENDPQPKKVGTLPETITQVDSSVYALQLLDDKGQVWEYSPTGFGLLTESEETESGFRSITLPEPVKTISSGGASTYAITETGKLYGWGAVAVKLDLENLEETYEKPVLIDDKRNYEQVSASVTHMIALTDTGILFSSGSTIYGALGYNGQWNNTLTPYSTNIEGTK